MALSYIAYASSASSSVALPAFVAGDLALVGAYRDGSNTPPSLPLGWTNIASSGADTNSMRVGYRVLQAGDTTTGMWTNATEIQVLVVRGQHLTTPIGAAGGVPGGWTSTSVYYPDVQVFDDPVRSWIVGFCGHRTATNVNTGVMPGMATRSAGSATTSVGCHTQADTFRYEVGTDTYWFDTIFFPVNANSGWRTYAFEVVEATPNQMETPTAVVSLAPGGNPVTRTAHKLNIRARRTNPADTGVMRVQLFEGATPRSSVLSTIELTTALADYTLDIPDGDAATIGNYNDLNVHFQGYSSEGTPTTFEVDQLWFETPELDPTPLPPVFPNVVLFAILAAGVPVGGEGRIAAAGLVYAFGDSDLQNTRAAAAGLVYAFGDALG